MICDVKMEDFRRNARLVAGGHVTKPPKSITYASVVSCGMVRIILTLAGLNDLEVNVVDIQNDYITAHVTERILILLGPEFVEDAGNKALVIRAL